jgi:hypothetical protein
VTKDKVQRDLDLKILSEESAKAILGVHKRHESLADEPSALDMKLLIGLYRGIDTAENSTIISPSPATSALQNFHQCSKASHISTRITENF